MALGWSGQGDTDVECLRSMKEAGGSVGFGLVGVHMRGAPLGALSAVCRNQSATVSPGVHKAPRCKSLKDDRIKKQAVINTTAPILGSMEVATSKSLSRSGWTPHPRVL